MDRTTRSTLTLVSGLPGVGKSTLAEAVGRRLQTPVFALDWLLGAAVQSRACHQDADFYELGRRLMLTLAHRQFLLRQSVILDAPTHEPAWRDPFLELAEADQVALRIVEVQCPDQTLHRARVEGRSRGIPGWHEFNWSHVERMKIHWQPWPPRTAKLVVDSTNPIDDEVRRIVNYIDAA